MTEKLLPCFELSKIAAFRLVCKRPGCGAVIEVTFDRVETHFENGLCKVCGALLNFVKKSHGRRQGVSWLSEFAITAAALTKGDILVDIEFVLPTKDACRLDRLPE
jgi:hypothetical protein